MQRYSFACSEVMMLQDCIVERSPCCRLLTCSAQHGRFVEGIQAFAVQLAFSGHV